jgi:hypothetical protein
MSDRPSQNLRGLDVDLTRRIDVVCRRFEAEWWEGRQECVENYLEAVPEEVREALRAELTALDRELRQTEEIMLGPDAGSAAISEPDPAPPAITDAPTVAPARLVTLDVPDAAPSSDSEDITIDLRLSRHDQSAGTQAADSPASEGSRPTGSSPTEGRS